MLAALRKTKPASRREKISKFMELRGISDWIEKRIALYYQPVASVRNAPNVIELLDLDVNREELVEQLTEICDRHWDSEEELDQALAFLETPAGRKLVDRTMELFGKLNLALENYMKTKLEEKIGMPKERTVQ